MVAIWARFSKRFPWTAEAASWLLWLGTLMAWITLGFGLLAEKTAPHVPMAWRAFDHHEDLAYWTVGLFTALSILRWLMRRSSLPGEDRVWGNLFLLSWLIACGLLLATAYFGGQLVYSFGMGIISS